MTERGHRNLPVWKASIELIEAFYVASAKFPREEMFGLQSQVRRAAVSVAANIAEGAARKSTAELVQFLYVANGSLSELDTHLEIAKRLGYVEENGSLQTQLDHVQGQLLAVIQSLKRRSR
jgi:four helix bundle protein